MTLAVQQALIATDKTITLKTTIAQSKNIMKTIFHSIILIATCWLATGSMTPCCAQVDTLDVREGTGVPAEVYTIYEKGANYLASTQAEDGTWVCPKGEANGICSLCVMAFLSTGEDPNFGKYSKNIRKALQRIIRDQDPETGYIQDNMYVHGFSMLALAEAYGPVDSEMLWAGQKKDDKTRSIGEALELAVRLAVTSQKNNPTNAWRYDPNGKTADTSAAGAVLMGLLAARNAGIAVPDESIDKALEYMKSLTSDSSGRVAYIGGIRFNFSPARSAIACLVYAIGKRTHWKEYEATQKLVSAEWLIQDSRPFYIRYYQAQALFQADYPTWEKWNRDTIAKCRKLQSNDGQIGESRHGRAFSTSMSLLALALNFKFLPIYER